MNLRRPFLCLAVSLVLLTAAQPGATAFSSSPSPLSPTTKANGALGRVNTSAAFQTGDVFAGVGGGKVNWYRSDGVLVTTLDTGRGGYTTGMAEDTDGNLYVTNFGTGTVSKFNLSGALLGTFGSYGGSPESIVFDGSGNAYVGTVDGDNQVRKFDPSGNLLAQFSPATVNRGTDWIDLATDQCTLLYTSEGSTVGRFNVCTNTQLTDFATGLPGVAYALRILPDGGILLADTGAIYRLNAAGAIINTYDAPGEDYWFALNLDPDGTSFWSGDANTGNIYRFDIASGAIRVGPLPSCGSLCLFGLAIYNERRASTFQLRLPFDLASLTSRVDGTDRINSYFDHQFPLERPALGGSEPQVPGIDDTILIYTGLPYPDAWTRSNLANAKWYSGHDGIDFRGEEGKTAVYAAMSGHAVGSQWTCRNSTAINLVTITQGRYRTVYLHLYNDHYWQDLVDHARDVIAGDRIGTVGNTGQPVCSSGAHLHFGVYYDVSGQGDFRVVDPYGFDVKKVDPWTQPPYNGPVSTWLWSANQSAQTNLEPGVNLALSSGDALAAVGGDAFSNPGLLTLTAIPDPSANSSAANRQPHSAGSSASIPVGSVFQLAGVYSDGSPLTTFMTPITISLSYGDLDLSLFDNAGLGISRWDEGTSNWTPLGSILDAGAKLVTATTLTAGTFSLAAPANNPAPLIDSISSANTNDGSGDVILTITGTHFLSTPWLDMGTTALDTTFVSSSMLKATLSGGLAPGVYGLVVRNPDGQTATFPRAYEVPFVNYLPIVSRP